MKPAASEAKKLTAWAMSSRRAHAPGGYGREVGVTVASATSAWRSTGMKPGATVLTVMPSGRELARPAAGQPDLRVLGRGVGGPARRRSVGDLGVDLDDPAVAARPHGGQHGAAEQHRALDEELKLGEVVLPRHLGHRRLGLRAGGVEHQHVDRAEAVGHRGTSSVTWRSSVTSAVKASAIPPPARIASATSPARPSPWTPLTATAKPSRARRAAMVLPSPRELPVTRATRRGVGCSVTVSESWAVRSHSTPCDTDYVWVSSRAISPGYVFVHG